MEETADCLSLKPNSLGSHLSNHKEGDRLGQTPEATIMSERATVCTASGVPLVDAASTSFPCPQCSHAIGRSPRCRNQAVAWICPECGFQGP